MSTKHERALALINARDFIRRLISPYVENGIKRIPKEVRREARYAIKHFPALYQILKDLKKDTVFICREELTKEIEKENKRYLKLFEKAMRTQHGKAKRKNKKA